jgi:hypothetical protein
MTAKEKPPIPEADLVARDVLGREAELVPAAAVDVEGADALLGAEGRILQVEIGAILGGRGGDHPERRLA